MRDQPFGQLVNTGKRVPPITSIVALHAEEVNAKRAALIAT